MFFLAGLIGGIVVAAVLLWLRPWEKRNPALDEVLQDIKQHDKTIWNLWLVNGQKFEPARLVYYDDEGLVIWHRGGRAAVPRHAISWINLSMDVAGDLTEQPLPQLEKAATDEETSSWRGFIESLKGDDPVSYTTTASPKPVGSQQKLKQVAADALVLYPWDDSRRQERVIVPLSALCAIGAEGQATA